MSEIEACMEEGSGVEIEFDSSFESDSEEMKIDNPQLHFLQHKAGMDNCDMDALAKRVYELTKNDPYYIKQQHKTNRARDKGF